MHKLIEKEPLKFWNFYKFLEILKLVTICERRNNRFYARSKLLYLTIDGNRNRNSSDLILSLSLSLSWIEKEKRKKNIVRNSRLSSENDFFATMVETNESRNQTRKAGGGDRRINFGEIKDGAPAN